MTLLKPIYNLSKAEFVDISKTEFVLIEAILYLNIYEELKSFFKTENMLVFQLMKYTKEMEDEMLEANFLQFIIKDILISGEYTIDGIARYTNTHEDTIHEILIGRTISPTILFLRKTIELHKSIRTELYQEILKKIANQYQQIA